MNVFLYVNNYTAAAVIRSMDALCDNNSPKLRVYVPRDICGDGDFDFARNIEVIPATSLEACAEICDYLITDGECPPENIEKLEELFARKRVFRLCREDEKESVQLDAPAPTILILRYGLYAQQCCTEAALCGAFRKSGINIEMCGSPLYRSIEGSAAEILGMSAGISPPTGIKRLRVAASSIGLFEGPESDDEIRRTIRASKPRFVILTVNYSSDFSERLRENIFYKYDVKIDIPVKSAYTPLKLSDTRIIPMRNAPPTDETPSDEADCLFAEDAELGEKLTKLICKKLFLPVGTYNV
ncbi:MAG: hypothetical protein LUE25_07640 [Clostridiales bacterium]|nr:hypothetical protein [Clostridiales bacterium]